MRSNGAEESRGYFGKPWLVPSVVGVAILALASGYGQFGVTSVLGDVADAFGESDPGPSAGDVGFSTTALGIGLAVIRLAGMGALPAASFADRYGRRLIVWLCGAGLVFTALSAAMPTYWAFIAMVALARPLLSGTNTVATVIAAEATDTRARAKAIAVAQVGYTLGSGAVVIVHGIGSEALGFRGVLAGAVVLLVAVRLIAPRVSESRLFRAIQQNADAASPYRKRLGAIRTGLRGRLALVACLAAVVALVTGPGFTFVFVYGENVLGVSPGIMAILVIGAGSLALPALLLGRWGADRFGRRGTAAAATAGLAVASTIAYSGGVVALAAGYAGAVAAGAAFGPAAGALVTELFPTADRSTASGWTTAAGIAGAVVGLVVFGVLIDAFESFATASAVFWLPLLPVVALYWLLPETRYRELE